MLQRRKVYICGYRIKLGLSEGLLKVYLAAVGKMEERDNDATPTAIKTKSKISPCP